MSSRIDPSSVPGLDLLIEAAVSDQWNHVDAMLVQGDAFITAEMFAWALERVRADSDLDIRELAAMILSVSNRPLNDLDAHLLIRHALSETYNIVKFRLAMALYKRNYMEDRIVEVMVEATKDAEVGPGAQALIDEKLSSQHD